MWERAQGDVLRTCLSGEVAVTLSANNKPTLLSGNFEKLELTENGTPATIAVDTATQNPVLKVKKVTLKQCI